MSLRTDIRALLKARFAAIAIANGYETNLGQKLLLWHTTAIDEAQRDALVLHDTDDFRQADSPHSGSNDWKLRVTVYVLLNPRATPELAAADCDQAIADVNAAVRKDERWNGLAKRSEQVHEKLMIDKERNQIAGAEIAFDIVTARRRWTS